LYGLAVGCWLLAVDHTYSLKRKIIRTAFIHKSLLGHLREVAHVGLRLRIRVGLRLRWCVTLLRSGRITLRLRRIGRLLRLSVTLRLLRIALRRVHWLLRLRITLRGIALRLLCITLRRIRGAGNRGGSGGIHTPCLHVGVPTTVIFAGLQIEGDGNQTS